MYASVAQCDQWDDMDTHCLLAGLADDDQDPRDLCSKATDGEGGHCRWCDVAFGAGVCVDSTQAQAAGRLISCDAEDKIMYSDVPRKAKGFTEAAAA